MKSPSARVIRSAFVQSLHAAGYPFARLSDSVLCGSVADSVILHGVSVDISTGLVRRIWADAFVLTLIPEREQVWFLEHVRFKRSPEVDAFEAGEDIDEHAVARGLLRHFQEQATELYSRCATVGGVRRVVLDVLETARVSPHHRLSLAYLQAWEGDYVAARQSINALCTILDGDPKPPHYFGDIRRSAIALLEHITNGPSKCRDYLNEQLQRSLLNLFGSRAKRE